MNVRWREGDDPQIAFLQAEGELRRSMIKRRPARYAPSSRPMPRRVTELQYGDDVQARSISQQGSLKWNGERTFLSEILAYEWMGCGLWMSVTTKSCPDR